LLKTGPIRKSQGQYGFHRANIKMDVFDWLMQQGQYEKVRANTAFTEPILKWTNLIG